MRIFLIYILNVYDALVTYVVLSRYGSELEVNPLMRWAFEAGIFLELKLIVVGILCYILYVKREEVMPAINVVLLIYFLLAIYHAVNLLVYF